jgi:hypothetical protein
LSEKFIAETLKDLNNWQPGPSDESYILDKIITQSIYTLGSTLVDHQRTQNGTIITQNRSDLAPILYGCLRTGLNKPKPVTVKIY